MVVLVLGDKWPAARVSQKVAGVWLVLLFIYLGTLSVKAWQQTLQRLMIPFVIATVIVFYLIMVNDPRWTGWGSVLDRYQVIWSRIPLRFW
jgi:hypothetical protein